MTERTLVERLRAIAEPRFSPLLPEEVTTLREAAAALEWLEKLEEALREAIKAIEYATKHYLTTSAAAEVESFINGYGGSPDARAALAKATAAPSEESQPPAEPRELVCMLCSTEYVPWFAPSELWNAAVRRSDGSDEFPFLCPTCFTKRAVAAGVNQVFVLSTDTEPHEREAELTHENERLRAALERLEKLEEHNHAAPAAGEREREPDATYRKALENALIHTAHLPHASRDLLEGLLASVARICKEALGIDTARTSAPSPQQGGEEQ